MTTLAILLIFLTLLAYGLKEYYQVKLGKPISTPPAVIDEIAEFLGQYGSSGRFIDLGSGWGSLVLALAKRLPDWQIDGIEASPTPWFIANCRSIGTNTSNYRFFIGRMEKQMLQNYDVVFLNQPINNLTPMLSRLARTLKTDTFVLSYPNPLPRLPNPDILLSEKNDRTFLYRGLAALAFLDPDPTPAPADMAPYEPAQEPVLTPADQVEPTDDNIFEQTPVDTIAPADHPADMGHPPPVDVPPTADHPEQDGPDQYHLPLQQTD